MSRRRKPTKEVLQQREAEAMALEARNTSLIQDLLGGMSHKALGERYGIAPPTVRDIIRETRDKWKEWRVESFDLILLDELERINWIQDEAQTAWEKSKEPLITQTRRTDGTRADDGSQKILYDEIKKTQRHPDPRYLDRISWCIEQKLKIIGAYAPEKIAATTPDGKSSAPFTQITFVEVVKPPPISEEIEIDVEPQALPSST